jgi:adenylosuccinate lyase
LDVDEETREELLDLTPAGYTGVAPELVAGLDEGEKSRS